MRVFAGTRWLEEERGRCISAGDFHAGARGRGESFGGSGGRHLARNHVSSPRWGLQTRRLPQLLSSPALLSCATIPAVQRLSFVVTLPAIAMEIEHHRFTPKEWDPRRGWEEGSSTFPCEGGTDGCQKAHGELCHGISRRPRGPPWWGTQHSTHCIPPCSPRRRQRRRGTTGTANSSSSLLSGFVALNPDPMGTGNLLFTAPSAATTSSKIINLRKYGCQALKAGTGN